jgi:hypothetical protein
MSSNADWEQFKNYWSEEVPRNGAIGGAVGGAVGGFIVALIVGLFIWCCLKYFKFNVEKPISTRTEPQCRSTPIASFEHNYPDI